MVPVLDLACVCAGTRADGAGLVALQSHFGARPGPWLGLAGLEAEGLEAQAKHWLSLSRIEKGCFEIARFQLVYSGPGFPY